MESFLLQISSLDVIEIPSQHFHQFISVTLAQSAESLLSL